MLALTAADAASLMENCDERGPLVPLAQFVMGWNRSTDRHSLIIAEPTGDQTVLAKLAVIVRALAQRDSIDIPTWVDRHISAEEVTLSGVNIHTDYGRLIKQISPNASTIHRVYFDAELLDR